MNSLAAASIQFFDDHPEPMDMYSDVIQGLSDSPRFIPPKYFYDEAGSKLFQKICTLPEYYPTRTEHSILSENAKEIAKMIGSDCLLIELGSGSCEKVRLLLDTLRPRAYVPMDISKDYLRKAAHNLFEEYPWLHVYAACMDFTKPIDLSFCPNQANKTVFFPGSSIGNFEPQDAVLFLSQIAKHTAGGLLIGVDLKKDPDILNAAYNDAEGVTAAFNMNLLNRINTELDASFDTSTFQHKAFYNNVQGRIEMHLQSKIEQHVQIDGQKFLFNEHDTIHTENSYKYSIDQFCALAAKAGYSLKAHWTDSNNYFCVFYFTV